MSLEPSGETPAVRVSDAERERIIELLREHCAAGRLDMTEFSDRVGEAYAARTSTELDRVLRELPVPARQRPVQAPPPPEVVAARNDFRGHLNVYLVVNAFLVFIWLVTSPGGYFWPMWPASGWGVALMLHWLGSRGQSS